MLVDRRGCGRTGQRDGADNVENVLDSLRSDLGVETDDGVGCRSFQNFTAHSTLPSSA
jgi:hypothetical protein